MYSQCLGVHAAFAILVQNVCRMVWRHDLRQRFRMELVELLGKA